MPAAGGNFLGAFWRRFCTKNTFLSAFWARFSRKNAPEILKIFRLRRAKSRTGRVSELAWVSELWDFPKSDGGGETLIKFVNWTTLTPTGAAETCPRIGERERERWLKPNEIPSVFQF